MQNWMIDTINQFGLWGIFLLIAIENIFPPIPSEVILTFGGFLTTYTLLDPWGVIFAATAGSVAGALVLYGVGRIFPPKRLEGWLGGKVGKALGFRPGDVLSAATWFDKKGKYTVLFCRCIPIVRSLISIPAGMAGMKLPPFLIMTTVGSFAWNVLLVWLGVFAGASWEKIVGYFDTYSTLTVVVLGLAFVICVLVFLKLRHKKRG